MSRKGYVPANVRTSGTDDLDPRSDKFYGYRSDKLRNPVGSLLDPNRISVVYNNFWFPPTTKVRCTTVPEYDSSGRGIKYVTLAITVEAIITPHDREQITLSNTDTDPTMKVLRDRLTEPGQPLRITGHGCGKIVVNDTEDEATYYDLDYGPKTQVIDWEPIAGTEASRIEWLVTTRISKCGQNQIGDEFFWFLENTVGQGFIDFSWDASWRYDELGFQSRTTQGSIELAFARSPRNDLESADPTINLDSVMAKFQQAQNRIEGLFPQEEGFKRTKDFSISKNKKVLSFTITDTEIPSPIGLPQGALQFDVEESLSSTLKDGFLRWKWRLTGSISVPYTKAGSDIINNKRLAFNAFYVVLQDRLSRTTSINFTKENEQNFLPPSGGTGDPGDYEAESKKITYYPTKISITNDVFGVNLNVDIEYAIICSASFILTAVGMFDAIQSEYRSFFDWSTYKDFLVGGKVMPVTVTGILPGVDWVVDFCHPFPTTAETPTTKNENSSNSFSLVGETPPEEKSWVAYENDFEILNDYNTIAATYLDDSATTPVDEPKYVASTEVTEAQLSTNITINENTSVSTAETSPIEVSTGSHPVTYIKMSGYAVRIGYPINPPRLVKVKKGDSFIAATHVKQDVIKSKTKPCALTKPNGASSNIYYLAWERTYAIQGVVTEVIPATSGQPSNYINSSN
jgi:hypothetical protein